MKKSKSSTYRKSVGYWDLLATHGPKASVIDPNDKRGHKNEYIAHARDAAILAALPELSTNARILDFGCGSGNLSYALLKRGFTVIGIDISPKLLSYAERSTGGHPSIFVQYDGASIPVSENVVDGIVVYVVFCYIVDDNEFISILRELCRTLKPGSPMVVIEQVRNGRKSRTDGMQVHRTVGEITEAFNKAGFKYQKHRIVRKGHFPAIYLIRYGLVPRFLYRPIARLEALLGRIFRGPRFDYAETLFLFTKKQ